MAKSNEIYQIMEGQETPAFRFCPKCGASSYLTSDKGRSFNCKNCGFHHYINSSAAVACLILNSEGELLLTRRAFEPNKGMLDLPGGFVEPMETAEQTVVREIMEELNLTVTKMHYLVSYPNLYPFSNIVVPTIDLTFMCTIDHFNEMKAGDDVASIEFIDPMRINFEDLCSNSMRQIIRFYLDNRPINE